MAKKKASSKKMTKEEKRDFDELYYYVKKLLSYDENQSLSRSMVLRLKGLSTNKFIENNNIESTASYSYQTILNTFKFCSNDIQRALITNSFNDENHKFNYVLKIVEPNINNIYMRMKNIEKAKEEAKNTSIEITTHVGAEYKPKEKKNDKFSDLW